MLNELSEVNVNLPNDSDEKLVNILFCYSLENWSLLNAAIRYMTDSKHFNRLFSVGGISCFGI